MINDILFDSPNNLLRTLITVIFAYPGLILLLRITGKRSLSKLNMFDFIITVALGSTLEAMIISPSVTVMQGLVALGLLLFAQYLISWSAVRWTFFERIINSRPTLVFHKGEFLNDAMGSVRLTRGEVIAEIRQRGFACLDDVYAVVLETNGVISVISQKDSVTKTTLIGLHNYNPDSEQQSS